MAKTNLWGGRFKEPVADLMRRFNDSFHFDVALLEEDVTGSIAWSEALTAVGVLTAAEGARMTRGLRSVLREARQSPIDVSAYEDIHSYVESRLREKIGALAGKLHTGRSRNDQVATDLRLWLRAAAVRTRAMVIDVVSAFAVRAELESASAMPGYTHLKQAEPVTFGHWCLAYAEMLLRDASRLADAIDRGNECPLGSGALAGSPLPIDRRALSRALGFDRPTANSLDGVSDRDFAAEFLFCGSLLLIHLSRFAEDVIFYSTDEVGFIDLPDALATGSSRMPQKKNPDLLELIRGHAGRSIGEVTGFLALLKGLPLAYDKDLQLDKEPLFRLAETLAQVLPLTARLVKELKVNAARMRTAASSDLLLATQVADAIAARGVPFREAHDIVSSRIAEVVRTGKGFAELGAGGGIEKADLKALNVDRALARKDIEGGTAPKRVRAAARAAQVRAGKLTSKESR